MLPWKTISLLKISLHRADKAYFFAIAKIMKVFHFQRLVDLYNNVPYNDALIATNSFPKFDECRSHL